ncbi:Alpha/Beta hydrolase protein [Penicillium angulare]|uniref:Alpha/Beta hydrolase protein n=1 Tax=Penicillium angulare TaxID=116970 RepID=A0A9W9GD86_9EURO|nr:Alpha/Beta hydrolase protein [Penicillium angulare]
MFQLSTDAEFAFVLETVLSMSNTQGAQTGEVLRAASQITPGDYESWYKEFKVLGDAIHARAAGVNATRFPVSAREAYFRSSTYYRNAPFFLHANRTDPRINKLGALSVADFDKAAALLPIPGEKFSLPATSTNVPNGNFTVPVRFFKGQDCPGKVPTVIVGTGYDASQEDSYHEMGIEILERGWNVITYEGPGQPTVLREQNLGFIPDWWNVVSPIVDYLETRKDVDMDQVALVGISFGGGLAPLAASREHRLSAVLSVDAMNDLYSLYATQLPTELLELYKNGDYKEFDDYMLGLETSTSLSTHDRWTISQGLFTFNTDSPSNWFGRLPAFTANATVLQNITCPVFVGEGENDTSAPGQAEDMVKALGNQSTYCLFRTDVGAGEHCQIGAESHLAQVTLDWLADVWDGIDLPANLTDRIY